MEAEREVSIYGQVYRVRGQDPDRIERVASHVDKVMVGLLGGPGGGLSTRGAVLTALNIADDWLSHRREVEKALVDLNQRVDELLHLLPE